MNQALSHTVSFPSIIDSSSLSSFVCPRKWFYANCVRLTPFKKSVHLHAGGAVAEMLMVVRNAYWRDKKSKEQSMFEGVRAFIRFWGDYEVNPDDFPKNSTAKYKDFYNTIAAVFDYFEVYSLDTDHIRPLIRENGDPAVEFTFAIPLDVMHPETGQPIIYGGRCDLIGKYAGMTAVVDEKTTYSFSGDYAKQFQMRGQFIGYTKAAQLSGINTRTAIVRGIGIQQTQTTHREVVLTFPQWQIDRWYSQMLKKVAYLAEQYDSWKAWGLDFDEAFPLNYGDTCASWGGCEYMDLCTSDEPESWYPSFAVNKWNPLLKDPTSLEEKSKDVMEIVKEIARHKQEN